MKTFTAPSTPPSTVLSRSFCIEKDQPECHYRLRQPLPLKPSKKSRRRPRGGASSSSPPPPAEGQSFWQTEEERAANAEMRRTFGQAVGVVLPLTRYETGRERHR